MLFIVTDAKEIASRVGRYLAGGSNVLQLPIGEVMLTCKLKSMDEEWVQKFVPFVNVSIKGNAGITFICMADCRVCVHWCKNTSHS